MSAYENRLRAWATDHGMTLAELRADKAAMAAARGHQYTPEHGKGALQGVQRLQQYAGGTQRASYSDRQAERIIYRAAVNEQRVQLHVHVKGEGWRTLGGARGYTASMVEDRIGAAGSIREAIGGGYLPGAAGHGDSDTLEMEEADDIDAWEVFTLE